MNESKIIDRIVERLSEANVYIDRDAIKTILGLFCESLLVGLSTEGKARIPGFGTFLAKNRKVAVNYSGKEDPVIETKCITFKPSRKFAATFRQMAEGIPIEEIIEAQDDEDVETEERLATS